MVITPSSVNVVGGGTIDSTTITPQYVELKCLASSIGGTVYTMEIYRGAFPLARIVRQDNNLESAELSSGVPNDVSLKNPTLDGNVRLQSSSYLTVTYPRDRVDCKDMGTYYCVINHSQVTAQYPLYNSSADLTVIGKLY